MTRPTEDNHLLRIGLAQIAPVWLDRERTILKVKTYVERASEQGCHMVAFGEALVPGYPFWLELTDGARFNSSLQKSIFAEYAEQAVQPEAGHLDGLCAAAAAHRIAIYLGTVERAADRGAHSLYCSLIFIDPRGQIGSVHRKLMPTYEERLVWSAGDGAGLRTHRLRAFHAGGWNCWENWMPLSRAALYAQGEDLHFAVWPGGSRNTRDCMSCSISGLMRREDIGTGSAWRKMVADASADVMADGGSCVADPDGEWVVSPAPPEETLLVATIDHRHVLEERQNFGPAGHYARPDVILLSVNRKRQNIMILTD